MQNLQRICIVFILLLALLLLFLELVIKPEKPYFEADAIAIVVRDSPPAELHNRLIETICDHQQRIRFANCVIYLAIAILSIAAMRGPRTNRNGINRSIVTDRQP